MERKTVYVHNQLFNIGYYVNIEYFKMNGIVFIIEIQGIMSEVRVIWIT